MPETTTAKTIVPIYVRLPVDRRGKDDQDARVVSLRIPEGIDPLNLLDLGFALDGNQAAFTIASEYDEYEGDFYGGAFDVRERTLTAALRESQRALVAFLRERGFEPRFD